MKGEGLRGERMATIKRFTEIVAWRKGTMSMSVNKIWYNM